MSRSSNMPKEIGQGVGNWLPVSTPQYVWITKGHLEKKGTPQWGKPPQIPCPFFELPAPLLGDRDRDLSNILVNKFSPLYFGERRSARFVSGRAEFKSRHKWLQVESGTAESYSTDHLMVNPWHLQ